jgi:ubiquinone/menaquinone biosynthesis C-methylase UbiE
VWSRFYDAPLVQRLTYRPVHDAVLADLRTRGRLRILDIGCGTGLLTTRMREELATSTVVGCDFSHGMLEQGARREPDKSWVQGNALQLPFRDAAFDAVVSTESFHWFPDQHAALVEFRRVLVDGGRALVGLVNPHVEVVSQATHIGSRLIGEPLYWPTSEQMRQQVEGAALTVERQQRIYRLPAGVILGPVLTVAVRDR